MIPKDTTRSHGEKFALVQALRGIAAVWVMMHHALGRNIEHLYHVLPAFVSRAVFLYGFLGVQIFFVLSGFIIAYSLRNSNITIVFLRNFAIKRSIRLDPAYWSAIAFAIAMGAVSAKVTHKPFRFPNATDLLSHLTYTQMLFGYPYTISPVFWTLTYEIQFYLILAISLMVFQKVAMRWGPLVSALLIFSPLYAVAWTWGVFITQENSVGLFYVNWYGFFAGALGYWSASKRSISVPFWALVIGLALSGRDISMMCALIAVLLHVALKTGHIVRSMSFAPIQFVGAISYSLYLTHSQVLGASMNVLYRYLPRTAAGEALAVALSTSCCIAAATLFWWLIERPSHNLAKRFAGSTKGWWTRVAENGHAPRAGAIASRSGMRPTE